MKVERTEDQIAIRRGPTPLWESIGVWSLILAALGPVFGLPRPDKFTWLACLVGFAIAAVAFGLAPGDWLTASRANRSLTTRRGFWKRIVQRHRKPIEYANLFDDYRRLQHALVIDEHTFRPRPIKLRCAKGSATPNPSPQAALDACHDDCTAATQLLALRDEMNEIAFGATIEGQDPVVAR